MRILQTIISVIFLLAALHTNATAQIIEEWTSGDYEIGSGKDWFQISELTTRNDVTVTMYEGGGVGYFWMYDYSELIKYESSVAHLYLDDNVTVSLYGGTSPMELNIVTQDPAGQEWVNVYLYAEFDRFEPHGPYGEGTFYGYWSANDMYFQFDLRGNGAYSHVQFIPEPASAVIFALGSLFISLRRKNR